LALIGTFLLILGILMILFFWPLSAYETKDTFDIENIKGAETVKYVGEITEITQSGEIYVLELDEGALHAYTRDENFEPNDNVVVIIKFGENVTSWDENSYTVEKIPTSLGILGALVFLLGIVVMSAGFIAKKLTVEDVVQFKVEPAPSPPIQTQPQAPQPAQGQTSVQASKTAEAAIQSQEMVHVTCPGCGNVFGIPKTDSPKKIKCPECGLEGRLD
jgi:predicted RNA-binding Zn-ribbon protein involved in translation (DUF1610 family)